MTQIGCRCGRQFSDTKDFLPYKATFVSDVDDENFFSAVEDAMASFAKAVVSGTREDWIRKHLGESYAADDSDEGVSWTYVTSLRLKYTRTLYECTACGRLLVEEPSRKFLLPYVPDDGKYQGVLRGEDGVLPPNTSLERTRDG